MLGIYPLTCDFFKEVEGVIQVAIAIDVVSHPAPHLTEGALFYEFSPKRHFLAHFMKNLTAQNVAKGIGRKITKVTMGPMHILQDPLSIILDIDPEII